LARTTRLRSVANRCFAVSPGGETAILDSQRIEK